MLGTCHFSRILLFSTLGWFGWTAQAKAVPQPFDFSNATWEKISKKYQDPKVYRWRAEGKDLFAFKGTGIINASMAKVVGVLDDLKRQKEWVPDLGSIRDVEVINPFERIQYLHIETPFIVSDRDFVYRTRASMNMKDKSMVLEFSSIQDNRIPKTKTKVRGQIVRGMYLLKSIQKDTQTDLVFQVYLDPKGSIPSWLVNATQRAFPKRTIRALRSQVKKKGVKAHPWVAAALEGKIKDEAHLQSLLLAGKLPKSYLNP